MRTTLLSLALITFAAPVVAKDPLFSLPIECDLGENCFIQNYVDTDPGTEHRDHTCGPLSYDGHKGTDIRVATLAVMHDGITVLAAAPGTVRAIRNDMPDIASNDPNAPDLGGKDCGNGLVISHGDGWETQYCHMKKDSVSVEKGQRVAKGAPLGLVGLSGKTEFPHIHLSVRHDGEVVDPFAPHAQGSCGPAQKTLWEDPIAYLPGAVLDVGFSTSVPKFSAIKAGLSSPKTLPSNAPALVIWGYAFGTRAGDTMTFNISGPEGWHHNQVLDFTKSQAQSFRASGRKRPTTGWPEGVYQGTITFTRNDTIINTEHLSVTISR